MSKTSGNVKNQLVPPWVTFQSLKNLKRRVEKMMVRLHELRDLHSRGQINLATSIYKNATLPLRISKMPLLGPKFGPFT